MGVLVQVRDVPEDVHRRLKSRAALAGTSLSEYLRSQLADVAARPTPEEITALLDGLAPAPPADETPAEAIRGLRDAPG
jgi:plasmid stability protein